MGKFIGMNFIPLLYFPTLCFFVFLSILFCECFYPVIVYVFLCSLMMPYLDLEIQTLKDGLVHGGTSLGQGATQGPTPGRHLQDLILGRHHQDLILAHQHLELILLAHQHLELILLAHQHLEPTQENLAGPGPTRVLLGPTQQLAPMVPLLDHW
jgi:hypothetical protein